MYEDEYLLNMEIFVSFWCEITPGKGDTKKDGCSFLLIILTAMFVTL